MRASEIISLKVEDIDSTRMVIRVEQGKGRKDRYAMLSPYLLDLLRAWPDYLAQLAEIRGDSAIGSRAVRC